LKTIPTKTVQKELHRSNIDSRAAVAKPLKGEKDGVMIIKYGHLMIGNT
jgi:hypothetical protein